MFAKMVIWVVLCLVVDCSESSAKTDLMKTRQVFSRPNQTNQTSQWTSPQHPQTPQLPQKVSRVRSNSTSMTSPPVATRKRTSSGMFQVDDSEPLAKKSEVTPSPPDTPRPGADAGRASTETPRPRVEPTNGRKKTDTADAGKNQTSAKKKDVAEKKKEKFNEKVDAKKVIEKFDSKAKSNCVSAFKESDSWD